SRCEGKKSPKKLGCGQLLVNVISLLRPVGTTEKLPVPLKLNDIAKLRFSLSENPSGNGICTPDEWSCNPVPGSTLKVLPLICGALTRPIPLASPTPTTINGLPRVILGLFSSLNRAVSKSAFIDK